MPEPEIQNVIPVVKPGDPISASGWNQIADTLNRPYDTKSRRSSSAATVAYITTVLPGRVGDTPGGPVTATILRSVNGADFVESDTVPVYSWVQSDTPDPTEEADGKLRIFISKGLDGLWWMHAIDCTEPAAAVYEAASTNNLLTSILVQTIPGTDLVIPYEGIYTYSMLVDLEIANVAGNQYWDVTLGIYSTTDTAWVADEDFAGTGTPVQPSFGISRTISITIDAAHVGDTLVLGAVRLTATGDVTVLAGSSHQIVGPLK